MKREPSQWVNPCPFCSQKRRVILADLTVAKTCPVCGKACPAHPIDTHGWWQTPSVQWKNPRD